MVDENTTHTASARVVEKTPDWGGAPPPKGLRAAILLGAAVIALAILASTWLAHRGGAITFDKPYQAVLLSNGQVYYGRLAGYGTSQPVLREVYYIQVQTNPETKEQKNILLKRGKEWHSPDRMYLNPNQIILVEPVGTDSKVADLIKELKAQ
ncbi:MAG TPA: hypothetical protein VKB88_39250 [Bryobacteraceae bacterium]|nr:hypothetical protein [Bryobacteraceae bacterium]